MGETDTAPQGEAAGAADPVSAPAQLGGPVGAAELGAVVTPADCDDEDEHVVQYVVTHEVRVRLPRAAIDPVERALAAAAAHVPGEADPWAVSTAHGVLWHQSEPWEART